MFVVAGGTVAVELRSFCWEMIDVGMGATVRSCSSQTVEYQLASPPMPPSATIHSWHLKHSCKLPSCCFYSLDYGIGHSRLVDRHPSRPADALEVFVPAIVAAFEVEVVVRITDRTIAFTEILCDGVGDQPCANDRAPKSIP